MSSVSMYTDVEVAEIISLFVECYGGPPILGQCVWNQYSDMEPDDEPCVICTILNGRCPTDDRLQYVRKHHG